jgi:DNA polymerase I-like protein with 3'-5' exonuclease and polymerase domains
VITVIDFETYYDQQFSLSKLTTEEYIRSDLFEVIGVAVRVDDNPTEWFSGTYAAVMQWLRKFDWDSGFVVAHNMAFDGAILGWRFGIHPKILADTLSMARATHGIQVGGSLAKLAEHYGLGKKGDEVVHALGKRRKDFTPEELAAYGRYCCNDVDLTYALFRILGMEYPRDEFRLIDQTLKMYTDPVLELDQMLLTQHLEEVQARKEALMARVGGEEAKKSIMSNPQFAQLLEARGVVPPTKISPTTGKETFAFAKTDQGMKDLLEHPDIEVQALAAARLGVKSTLEETRTQRFLSIADRGALPIPLKYYAAHTSRWGGWDLINLQNLPSRGANKNKLKKAIRAPKGYVIIDADSSQIEARILAWLAGQTDLVEAFRNMEDVYKQMASAIYNIPESEVTDAQRFVGKSTILGSGYGMGPLKFKAQLKIFNVDIEHDMANHIINTYRNKYAMVPHLWNDGLNCLRALIANKGATFGRHDVVNVAWGMVHTPLGIPLSYPDLRVTRSSTGMEEFVYTSRSGVKGIWGGAFTENIVQHLARLVVGLQLLKIAKRYRVVLTVHDAVACIAPKSEAEEALKYVQECMRWVPPWAPGLPLNCDIGMGETYGDC